ncbi:helix-turn-helix transcriptional regulator [Pseudarthrobacter sp. YAF2]|uniref:helix-turn-helix transcriptional regulator n=1 Tax=Pseudarthrobacter sp. YAF2 TaxID=3233078 RepID=UPI003F9D0628
MIVTSLPDDPQLYRRTVDGERLIAVFSSLVEPIGRALPATSEVVLHDLSLLPNSLVAVYGDVTGRRVGDPATDLLLEQAVKGFPDQNLGYETKLADGRKLRSSTMIIRDVAGVPVAALCINTDVSTWQSVMNIAQSMMGRPATPDSAEQLEATAAIRPVQQLASAESDKGAKPAEVFVKDVDELAAYLIRNAITAEGVPVKRMKKEHKIQVVRVLKGQGMFLLREAVEMIAESLEVSRFTIYNYLNEIEESDNAADTSVVADRKA